MWFSVTLWTVLASLLCSSVAYSSSRHSGFPDYDAAHKTGYSEPRWTTALLDDYEGKDPGSPSSSSDTENLPRQMFDGKSSEAAAEVAEASLLAHLEEQPQKRQSHSLSIVNPLDVLRQRLMLEMARRRMKENQDQIRENALILKNLGKRASHDGNKQDYLRRIHVSNNEDFDV